MEEQNTTKKDVARMRSIRQCVAYIKEHDSETCISEFFIRQLCRQNKIKWFASGSKSYVDMDYLLNYLSKQGA